MCDFLPNNFNGTIMILLGISTSVQAIMCDDFPGFLFGGRETDENVLLLDYYYIEYLYF